jgi:hypothetical protein
MTESNRFPDIPLDSKTDSNLAVRAFGRRFYRDQTPLEYLAEFLLCFSSPKQVSETDRVPGLPEFEHVPRESLAYWPESRLALKLFSFFSSSKLETRHPAHVDRFKQLISDLEDGVEADQVDDKHRAVAVLQQLFSGFVGVAGQRTWATHSFIPASRYLLSREVDWRHSKAVREGVKDWEDAKPYFTSGSHNFMARGGEVLFLQIWHTLREARGEDFKHWLKTHYDYIESAWSNLPSRVESGLQGMLEQIDEPLAKLGSVIEKAAKQEPPIEELTGSQNFGWVPRASRQEAALFAWEIGNIVASQQDPLRKVRVLQELCCLQVLRSLCFQSARLVDGESQPKAQCFAGGYAWITVASNAGLSTDLGKASHASQSATEELLFKAVRSKSVPDLPGSSLAQEALEKADEHGFKLFRALGKQIGLIIPRTGPMRFTLPSSLVEATTLAVVPPGERVSFDDYLWRLYRHFGIAVGAAQIEAAASTLGDEVRLAPQRDSSAWLEDELNRGGFLIPLSDATPLVKSPA